MVRYYKADLNPGKFCGLVNQLYALVQAILIGHYTDRRIAITGFYPQYDSDSKISLGKIIDLPSLNQLINKLNLSTSVSDDQELFKNCAKSRYPLITIFGNQKITDAIDKLKSEPEDILDIEGTFLGSVFFGDSDPSVSDLAIKLLIGISFAECFDEVIRSFNLGTYKSVHLRLEDDMLAHQSAGSTDNLRTLGERIYQEYKSSLAKFATSEEKIFLSTDLTKKHYTMNYVIEELRQIYPNIFLTPSWRQRFPSFYVGREIDAIIDYMIARNGTSFLGCSASTFSGILTYAYLENEKNAYWISDSMERYPSVGVPFTVLSSKVSHGKIGLSGNLGFNEHGVTSIEKKSKEMISAHAFSTVKIKTTSTMHLRGSISPTSKVVPEISFYCDDQLIGKVDRCDQKTPDITITPGIHILKATTSNHFWAHSIWLIDW